MSLREISFHLNITGRLHQYFGLFPNDVTSCHKRFSHEVLWAEWIIYQFINKITLFLFILYTYIL